MVTLETANITWIKPWSHYDNKIQVNSGLNPSVGISLLSDILVLCKFRWFSVVISDLFYPLIAFNGNLNHLFYNDNGISHKISYLKWEAIRKLLTWMTFYDAVLLLVDTFEKFCLLFSKVLTHFHWQNVNIVCLWPCSDKIVITYPLCLQYSQNI